ncbi:LacI family transcriptional regulator [Paenibacillus alkaliterrae]|uniref:LacI family DNA-binding transcriptional regulator n=1 Tax=Paenibacillus alkaliterrae TaxID=320909 RepID=UPI001F3B69C3|nr:LacI family DNA-binding transcriptional regulator [Paenibacillus alkaliterrae]MCF2941333.1 LacI family transcriptional regulator [Paenibacillus alkaliterrae]
MSNVTIKDVALLAEVSVGTVSRYINGYQLKAGNRKKIEKAIEELDFKINPLARGLRSSKTFTIGVLIPRISDVFCTQVIEGIEEAMASLNYSILICSSNDSVQQQTDKMNGLMDKCVDGIIVMPVSSNEWSWRGSSDNRIPIVLIDRLVRECEWDAVVSDNVNGAYSAVEMLINHGHRKIGIIAGPQNISTAQERLTGYMRALNDYNIVVNDDYIVYAPYTKNGGIEAVNRLVGLTDPPTAIFSTNHPTTVNSLKVLMEKELVIGNQISLCGYDQTELFQMFTPPISVVVQPARDMGISAATTLMKRINGDYEGFPLIKRLKTQLIATSSVKKI